MSVPEVFEQARADGVPAAAGRTARRYDGDVSDVLPRELVHVVVAALVHELTQQLQRRLRAVLFRCRHVEVIHKHEHLSTTQQRMRQVQAAAARRTLPVPAC